MALNMGNSAFKDGSIPTKTLAHDASFENTDPRVSEVPAMDAAADAVDAPKHDAPKQARNPTSSSTQRPYANLSGKVEGPSSRDFRKELSESFKGPLQKGEVGQPKSLHIASQMAKTEGPYGSESPRSRFWRGARTTAYEAGKKTTNQTPESRAKNEALNELAREGYAKSVKKGYGASDPEYQKHDAESVSGWKIRGR